MHYKYTKKFEEKQFWLILTHFEKKTPNLLFLR